MISLRLNISIFFEFYCLIKRSFFNAGLTSSNQLKLALIPQYCYHLCSFNNNDNYEVRTLLHTQISHRAGEKGSNRSLSKLTGALGSAFVGATIMLSPMVANANDANTMPSVTKASVAFPPLPERTEAFCAPLQENRHGLMLDASGSAFQHSKKNPGTVGISVAKGRDLTMPAENLGTILVNTFRGAGVDAECFVSPHGAMNGTAISLNVNGVSWKEDGFMNLDEVTDRDELRRVVAEAKTGKLLLTQASLISPKTP